MKEIDEEVKVASEEKKENEVNEVQEAKEEKHVPFMEIDLGPKKPEGYPYSDGYEFSNLFMQTYKPKNQVDSQGGIPDQLYLQLTRNILSVSAAFPEFQDEISALNATVGALQYGVMEEKHRRIYFPGLEGANDGFLLSDDENVKKGLEEVRQNYLALMDKMLAYYNKDTDDVRRRLIMLSKNYAEHLGTPNAVDELAGFSEYYHYLGASMVDMPDPSFRPKLANGKLGKNYEIDHDRYRKFMKEHVFLDQIEDRQNFFLNENLPYTRKLREGTATREDADHYNKAYLEHLLRQKAYFEKIEGYDHSDPDIAANQMCNNEAQFIYDWKGTRFGKNVLRKIDRNLAAMDRGWPAADMTFLDQLELVMGNLKDISENKLKKYTAEEKKAAKSILSSIKKPYQAIMTKEIHSPEERMELLNNLMDPIKKYAELEEAFRGRQYNSSRRQQGKSSISWLFDDAKSRMVFRNEVGKNRSTEEAAKGTIVTDLKDEILYVYPMLSNEEQAYLAGIEEFQMLSGMGDVQNNPLNAAVTVEQNAPFQIEKTQASMPATPILNQENMEAVNGKIRSLAKKMEAMIKENVGEDEIGEKMMAFYKANVFSKMERASKGYSETALAYLSPMAVGTQAFQGLIDAGLSNDALRNKMKKWGTKFPIYDLTIECGKQTDTFVDYFEEKKKNGGKLSPERENFYRQKIYDQITAISPLYSKVCAAGEKAELTELIKTERVLMEEAFHMHPLASRGSMVLSSTLETYKAGLENGWGLDDLPALTAFHYMMSIIEKNSLYNSSTSLKNLVRKDPQTFRSPEEKEVFDKMQILYRKMKYTPLQTAEQRKEYLEQMDQVVQEGIQKHVFSEDGVKLSSQTGVSYYRQCRAQMYDRDIQVARGKANATLKPMKFSEDRKLEGIMTDLNARRTDLWFSSENEKHKNLRVAMEETQKFLRESREGHSPESRMKYLETYLNKLDTVQHTSRLYQEKRAGASSRGGKQRLLGAREASEFVEREKLTILEKVNAVTGNHYESIDEFRMIVAVQKKQKAQDTLRNMQAMPRDAEGKKQMTDLVADLVVGVIAAASDTPGYKTFTELGLEGFKKEILKNSDFKNLLKDCMRDRTMTPERLANGLRGENVQARLERIKSTFGTKEAAAQTKADAKQAIEARKTQERLDKAAAREAKLRAERLEKGRLERERREKERQMKRTNIKK